MPIPRRWPAILVAGALLQLTNCRRAPAEPAAVTLSAATDTVHTPYVDVSRATWLGGRQWAIMAPNDSTVGIVDFATDTLSRLADGQTVALRRPATVFTVQDTLYVSDWGLRQITLWTTDGRWVRSVPTTDAVRGALPQARDAAGRFYVELSPLLANTVAAARDSAAVAVTDATLGHVDTVAHLAPLDVAEVMADQGRRFERRVFSGTDRWGVLADGSVWVARVYRNRVDWRSPDGAWREGQALPDRVLEVTRYDRELFIRKFPKELRSMAQQLPFAAVKPPFEDAFGAADGTVWLIKSRAPTDSAGQYHVVGRDGRLLRDLRIPGHGRIIGASGDAAIVTESTPRGVRLLRFVLPPLQREVAHAN